jgi:hypothetical protein
MLRSGTASAEDTSAPSQREYYELRLYQIESAENRAQFEEFLGAALIPAWNRLEISPVGVFRFLEEESFNLYVLLPHKSAASAMTSRRRVMDDARLLEDGAEVVDAPKSAPVYQRVESSLLVAFAGLPELETPTDSPNRVLQLRIYESHSEKKALKKIDMFNVGGEIAIFRKTGLNPVFFGEALFGTRLPNLTYMLAFENREAMAKAWDAFLADPDWMKLKGDPQYADTVSKITNTLLTPAACSQI